MSVSRPSFARRIALTGLALSLFTSAATPLLAGHDHDAAAKSRKPGHGVSQERKGTRAKIVTRTFRQQQVITIPDDVNPAGVPADPYPATLQVRGFARGRITDVDLTLHGFVHEIPPDVDILLVKDDVAVQVVGDVGDISRDDVTITLDDEAERPLPYFDRLRPGRFWPTDHDSGADDLDTFRSPAPASGTALSLAAFDGLDPNGAWQLYVIDARNPVGGSIDGWELTLQVQVKEKGKKRR